MTGIYSLFVVLIVIVAILMILIVLIQESKGGGLSSQFAGGNAMLGVRKTTNAIEKAHLGLSCRHGCAQHSVCLCSSSGSRRRQRY